jgi:cyanobactin biosynthesis protein (PatB/AcyB/McaB family)
MSSTLPIQSPPVQRPSFVDPYETLHLADAKPDETLYWMFMLIHGSNFNDPPQVGVDMYRKRGSI